MQVATKKNRPRPLILGDLTVSPRLARCLSPTVARRYHALPVVEDSGHITVAMADPDDVTARDAVTAALGAPACVVEGDPVVIDALLAEIWPELLSCSLRLLVCAYASPIVDEVSAFSQALGGLLQAHVSHFSPIIGADANCDALAQVTEQSGYNLVIWGEPGQPLVQRLLSGPAYHKATERVPASLLVTRRPRWPLRRLLLIIQGDETDDAALDWVLRLARPSGAEVTLLAVVPPVPAMYNQYARMQQGLDVLLETNTALGRQMRQMARCLVEWEVESTLRLRQGPPDQQIQIEIAQGDYDLVSVAASPSGRWRHWVLGDTVASLLRWGDRPVLIAKLINPYS